MYNDRKIELSERDLEIIRRVQAGTFAHPEFNDTPDYIDYFSSIKMDMVSESPTFSTPPPTSSPPTTTTTTTIPTTIATTAPNPLVPNSSLAHQRGPGAQAAVRAL